MPNDYFQFKKFIIYQDKCSMKVCTDACLLGAWIANKIESKKIAGNRILDIGAGTGLLSLMIAQKNPSVTDAVEIDENAFIQAKENFSNSPWGNRLQCYNVDVKNFIAVKKYSLIVSNPPFHQQNLKSPSEKKNLAHHDTGLNAEELILAIKNNLKNLGSFVVLLPFYRLTWFEKKANENKYFIKEKLLIKATVQHPYSRCIVSFNKTLNTCEPQELIIKNEDGNYSAGFIELMSDYYIAL